MKARADFSSVEQLATTTSEMPAEIPRFVTNLTRLPSHMSARRLPTYKALKLVAFGSLSVMKDQSELEIGGSVLAAEDIDLPAPCVALPDLDFPLLVDFKYTVSHGTESSL